VALIEKGSNCGIAWAKEDSPFVPGNPNTDVHTDFAERQNQKPYIPDYTFRTSSLAFPPIIICTYHLKIMKNSGGTNTSN
jgi:hypothetical protein